MTYFTKTYDEAFINENSVRTNYKKLISWYKNQDNNELTKINSDAMKFFENTGVSFKVYSSDKKENLIPFDIIPRIINSKEWDKLVKGITQRVLAINFFLDDIYGEQEYSMYYRNQWTPMLDNWKFYFCIIIITYIINYL